VDQIANPAQIVVRARGGEMFASVECSEVFLHEALDLLGQLGQSFLIDSGVPESIQVRGRVVERTHFSDCDPESEALQVLRQRLPSHLEVRMLDRGLLGRCPFAGRTLPKLYGGKLDAYFDFGYGICLLQGEDVVSEVYAGYVTKGKVEVIAGTAEAYRGQGLASIAGALLVEEARRRGHRPTWSCRTDNVASMKVARRLRFRTERPYRMVFL
jgi:GNAT superfamily N-acetyltransferase